MGGVGAIAMGIGADGGAPLYSVLLPTYNERENLPLCVWLLDRELQRAGVSRWEVVVVDDASPDGTQDVARKLQEHYGEERIVRAAGSRRGAPARTALSLSVTLSLARAGVIAPLWLPQSAQRFEALAHAPSH